MILKRQEEIAIIQVHPLFAATAEPVAVGDFAGGAVVQAVDAAINAGQYRDPRGFIQRLTKVLEGERDDLIAAA